MVSNFGREILKKQLQELSKNLDGSFSVGLVDDSDFFKWSVCFTGPEDTLYEVLLTSYNKGRFFQGRTYVP